MDRVVSVGCGASVAWPLAVFAQQRGKLPTIGFMGQSTRSAGSEWTAAFVVAALADQVICENQRSAPGKAEQRRKIASYRLRRQPPPHRSKQQLPKPSELQLFARRLG
jgi:hypothetical protein